MVGLTKKSRSGLGFVDNISPKDLPYFITKICELGFVDRVEPEGRFWFNQDPGVKLSLAEHDCSRKMGILAEETFCIVRVS